MMINNVMFNVELLGILNELKSQLNLRGIFLLKDIRDSGNNIMVTCPFHKDGQESKPSAGFLKTDGTFHCFTCGEVHTLQEVISYCFGKNDLGTYGWTWLLQNFLNVSIESRKPIELDLSRNVSCETIEYVSEEELDSYRYYHPYMYERKLTNEIIEMFDIGFDSGSSCITFPIRDISGNCLCIARRSVKTKWFNYPSNITKPIYGIYEINRLGVGKDETIIICESMLDCLTCWVYGKKAVAMNGLGTNYQFEQLRNMPNRKFILATDNDSAGLNARKKLKKELYNKIVSEYIFPKGIKDINEMDKETFENLEEIM